jgi:hypothetical protein
VSYITRKGKVIQEHILEYIQSVEHAVSTRQIALKLEYSWITIQNHCLELTLSKKIDRLPFPGAHLWISQGKFATPDKYTPTAGTKSTTTHRASEAVENRIDRTVIEILDKEIEEQLEALEAEIRKEQETIEKNIEKNKVNKQEKQAKEVFGEVMRHE